MNKKEKNIILKTKNLSIGYASKKKKHTIISNINITINEGELVGIIGANGIGKSTLLRTLTKVQPALSGAILLQSKNLNSYSSNKLAKLLSIVLTENIASKNLTVKELIALGRQPYTNWLGRLSPKDITIINQAITNTNTTQIQDKKCFELSDGQLQNVMIARALAQETPLILLDEPTTHLDIHHKAYLLKLLKKLTREANKTIVFSSHEINLAIQLCDSLLVITKNKIIQDSPKALIEKEVFNTLFPKNLITFDSKTAQFKITQQ